MVKQDTKRNSVYLNVRRKLFELVDDMSQRGEAKLPSEGRLCQSLGVSRPLVRRALNELKSKQQITSVPGKGHFIQTDNSGSNAGREGKGIINVVLGSTQGIGHQASHYLTKFVAGVEAELEEDQHRVVFEWIGPKKRPVSNVVAPYLSDMAGVILLPLEKQSPDKMLTDISQDIPAVVAGRPVSNSQVASLYVDHFGGAKRATEFLLNLNHQRIAVLSRSQESWVGEQRLRGHKAALRDAGIEPQNELVRNAFAGHPEQQQSALRQLLDLKPRPTALLVPADFFEQVWTIIQEFDIQVPDDLSLVTFDDSQAVQMARPAVTVVKQPVNRLGRLAAQLLIGQLENGGSENCEPVVLETEILLRSSTAPVEPKKALAGI